MNAHLTRRLVVNADDFGISPGANSAVIQAHREGILTTASLMTNEPGTAEAVSLARHNPALGVGLHLTLLCGHAALRPERIPGLVNSRGELSSNPAAAGCRYFFFRQLRAQLRDEIHEQFRRFRETSLPLDHVNAHLHMHLHPVIFGILMQDAAELKIQRMRLTREPLRISLRTSSGRWLYRLSHAAIFGSLAALSRNRLRRRGIHHTGKVFGLLQNAAVDESYILRLLPELPPGDSELYSHPSLDEFRPELDALLSPRVRGEVDRLGIQLIRYQDL